MRLTLPIFSNMCSGYDVVVSIQLFGKSDLLTIKCTQKSQIWGDKGLYSTYGLIEFNTKDIKTNSSEPLPYIDHKNIKFIPKTKEQMKDWFYEHYQCFVDKE